MPKILSSLDLNKNELKNAVIQKGATAPSNPAEGQVYYNTTDKNFYRYNGTNWVTYQNALDTAVVSEVSIDSTPTQSSTNLVTSGGVYAAIQAGGSGLPDQTGHSGEFLTTDGTDASWANPAYPVTSVNNKTGSVTLTASDVGALSSSTSIPSPADATPLMDGTAAVGTSTDYAREDHVHPTDTGRASSTHTHGNITNGGDITTSSTIASGDRLVINDESNSKITNSSITFGTSETQFLTNKGTWATPSYPVTSVNTKTGAVSLTASDVSAIPTANLVTSVSSSSTNSQVPSAKLFYDTIGDVESVLETLLSGSA